MRALYEYVCDFFCIAGAKDLQMVVQEPWAQFGQLQPYTNYSFYVVAYSERSPSASSEVIVQRTDEDGKYLRFDR